MSNGETEGTWDRFRAVAVSKMSIEPHPRGAPKGHVEAGEGAYAAAVRETAEEAGLDAAQELDVHENFTVEMK